NAVEVSATTLAGSDAVPPTFAGLATARAMVANAIDLSWAPATDNVTASDGIVYLVYRSTTAGGEDVHAPVATSPAGATSAPIRARPALPARPASASAACCRRPATTSSCAPAIRPATPTATPSRCRQPPRFCDLPRQRGVIDARAVDVAPGAVGGDHGQANLV